MIRRQSDARPTGRWASFLCDRETHRQTLRAPRAGRSVEHSGKTRSALQASAACVERPLAKLVPIAFDHARSTATAVSAGAGCVVHVAGVDIAQSVADRDLP